MIDLFIRMHTWCLVVLAQPGDTRAVSRLDPLQQPSPDEATALPASDGQPAGHHRQMADCGQATTEYALVMLGAAAVALLVITWATAGGGAGRIGRLFDHVIDSVVSRI